MSTKEKILESALTLFSRNGYSGTSVEQIAGRVGIKAPSLYKHFKGKADILNNLIDLVNERYDELFGSAENIGEIPDSIEEFIEDAMKRIDFTMHDPIVIKMRKMIVQEQFRNEKFAETTTKHQLYGIQRMYAVILKKLMDKGILKKDDPELMAMEITAPVVLYLAQVDRQPKAEKSAIKNIERHLRHFCDTYKENHAKEKTTLTFTGDIGFDHFMAEKWTDPELVSKDILDVFHGSDHVILNVEGPLIDKDDATLVSAKEMRLMHTIDPASVPFLKSLGDIWNLCNNHIMDAGSEGLKSSMEKAKSLGIPTLGVGMDLAQAAKPVILDEAGGIGLFAVGYQRGCKPAGPDKAGCLNWADFDTIQKTIDEIKSKCRWCILVSHGGEEFTSLPSPYTRDRYLKYLEMGVDIIVCHHPHVPMNYELVGDKAIFYSLGNFIFDTNYQRAQYNTEKGIVLSLTLTEKGFDFTAHGITIDRDKEHVVASELPLIFENVGADEYELLAPLSAKAFVEANKKQQIFLYPDQYKNADEAKWKENFMNPKRSGRVEGEALDFQIICPFAETADEGAWKESKLENVKKYILDQLSDK